MGLLDMVTSVLGGTARGTASNDTATILAQKAFDVLQAEGGVSGLLERFGQHGLAEAARSWVSTGANLPISSADIQRVLGSRQVQEIARSAGVSTDLASGHLADVLPKIIDQLTPGGKLPDGAMLDTALSALRNSWGR